MTTPKDAQDNRANQLNQTHSAYRRARGASPEEAEQLAADARAQSEQSTTAPKGTPK